MRFCRQTVFVRPAFYFRKAQTLVLLAATKWDHLFVATTSVMLAGGLGYLRRMSHQTLGRRDVNLFHQRHKCSARNMCLACYGCVPRLRRYLVAGVLLLHWALQMWSCIFNNINCCTNDATISLGRKDCFSCVVCCVPGSRFWDCYQGLCHFPYPSRLLREQLVGLF